MRGRLLRALIDGEGDKLPQCTFALVSLHQAEKLVAREDFHDSARVSRRTSPCPRSQGQSAGGTRSRTGGGSNAMVGSRSPEGATASPSALASARPFARSWSIGTKKLEPARALARFAVGIALPRRRHRVMACRPVPQPATERSAINSLALRGRWVGAATDSGLLHSRYTAR